MSLNKRLVLLFLAGIFSFNPVLAEIYKWVDESGKVHFSDQPQQGAEQVQVETKSAVHDGSKSSAREINRRIAAVNRRLGTERLRQQNASDRERQAVQAKKTSSEKSCQYYKDKLANLEYEWELRETRKGYKQSQKDKYLTKKDRYRRDIARTCG